jgi:hypothetical protein
MTLRRGRSPFTQPRDEFIHLLAKSRRSQVIISRPMLKFTPYSARKFKEKIKEWKFEKYLTAEEMKFIAAKAETRARERGKGTEFYKHGAKINQKRIEKSAKRKREEFEKMDAAIVVGTSDEISQWMTLILVIQRHLNKSHTRRRYSCWYVR